VIAVRFTLDTRTLTRLFAATAAVNGLLLLLAQQEDPRILALGSMVLWLCAMPVWHHYLLERGTVPFALSVALVYFVAYGLPAFGPETVVGSEPVLARELVSALEMAACGAAAFVIGYFTIGRRLIPGLRGLGLSVDVGRMVPQFAIGAVVFTALRLVSFALPVPEVVGQIVGSVTGLGLLCANGLVLCWLRGHLAFRLRLLTVAIYALHVFVELGGGAIARPLLTLCMAFFVYVRERKVLPIKAMALTAAVAVPFMATKYEFRNEVWGSDAGLFERSTRFLELTRDMFLQGSMSYEDATTTTRTRANHLGTLARVITLTPDVVPYWGGETYSAFLWSFVPRVLYPDKPRKVLGQEFGHRYDLLNPGDQVTSYNFEQLVEMYANFGPWGVLIGMLLLSTMYRILVRVLLPEGGLDAGALVGATLLPGLLVIECDFSMVHGLIVQNVIIYYMFLRIIGVRSPKSTTQLRREDSLVGSKPREKRSPVVSIVPDGARNTR
jgi:hypothetical protein